jgi:hypothetical protein
MIEHDNIQEAKSNQTHSSWLPKVTIDHLWLAVPIALTAGVGFLLKLRLIDFWWHLKAGEIIVKRVHSRTDLFSFTAARHPFIFQNWLVEVIYSRPTEPAVSLLRSMHCCWWQHCCLCFTFVDWPPIVLS